MVIFVRMKWFVYLFSLYVLVLSGIHCDADDDCCSDGITHTTASHDQDAPKDHKPVSPCSPFFACGVCHGVVIPEPYTIKPVALMSDKELHSNYIEPQLGDFFPAIWQPPKHI